MPNLVTAGECASKMRYHSWPIIKANLSPKDRLYNYDEIWGQYVKHCTNYILPNVPNSVPYRIPTDHELGLAQQAYDIEKKKENELTALIRSIRMKQILVGIGFGVGAVGGYYLYKKYK